MAQRHVAEGRERLLTIELVLAETQARGDRKGAAEACRLLPTFETCLRIYEDDWERMLRREDCRLSKESPRTGKAEG
jgi:hypothetical protein